VVLVDPLDGCTCASKKGRLLFARAGRPVIETYKATSAKSHP
jgi:hypothetical protein